MPNNAFSKYKQGHGWLEKLLNIGNHSSLTVGKEELQFFKSFGVPNYYLLPTLESKIFLG